MKEAIIKELRKTSVWMGFFAGFFVLMYTGVVLLTSSQYIYFKGYLPDTDKTVLRVIFYGLTAVSVYIFIWLRKKRYSKETLNAFAGSIDDLMRHLILSAAFSLSMAEAPLISGFFLFFLGAMYLDFFILTAVAVAFIVKSIPGRKFLSERLGDYGEKG